MVYGARPAMHEVEMRLLLAKHSRPVLVCLLDIALPVLIPDFLNFFVQVQVQFTIDNCPGFRVDICRGPTAYGIGSVAAVLRGILFRVFPEYGKVFLVGKKPSGPLPFMLECFLPFDGSAKFKIGYRVVALNGDTFGIYIYGRYLC